nr:MOSC domain-containing protein [Iodidimonas gelatinilytica]
MKKPGAFGENISTVGLIESQICIGDIFHMGTALVQVSQGRQPCWRLNERFSMPAMARRVQETGRTGWYYRVLEDGDVTVGDRLVLVERPLPDWSLSRILQVLYRDTDNKSALSALADMELLADSWRSLARKRLERGGVEDWAQRLNTPDKSPT